MTRRRTSAALVAVVLLATGCGGGGEGAAPTPADTPSVSAPDPATSASSPGTTPAAASGSTAAAGNLAELDFVERHGLGGMPHAVDADGRLWARYGVSYQPAWVFIDEDGDVEVHAGGLYGDGIGEAIDALIAR